ncbi:MAG: hypothetical protein AB8I08_38505 [Sandaracinaceae bacterium]
MPTHLFGDSQPFEGGYDFLAELRAFVRAASQVLVLAHQADELEQNLGDRAQAHLHAIEAIQAFFDHVQEGVTDRAARSAAPTLIAPFAKELLQQVEAIGARAKQSRANDLDADSVAVTSSIRDKRTELRSVMAAYLLTDPLPTESWAMSLNLGHTSPQGQVVLSHPAGLTTRFTVEVSASGWAKPRKVGELCPGMALQVGMKKAFLRSSLHPDIHTLDDFYLGELELGPDSMEVHLRRKPDASRDAYVVELDIDDAGRTIARVTNRREKGGEAEPFNSQGEDVARLRELATALRREVAPLVRRKRRLVAAHLDGHDMFERGLARQLFERIIAAMTPVALAVAQHSPNPQELSLKVESDEGRREEIYLRKQELIDMVSPLPEEKRALFRPLEFLPPAPAPSAPPPPPAEW